MPFLILLRNKTLIVDSPTIVVTGITYQSHLKGIAVHMMHVGLKPLALLWEVVWFESCKVSTYLRDQVCLTHVVVRFLVIMTTKISKKNDKVFTPLTVFKHI